MTDTDTGTAHTATEGKPRTAIFDVRWRKLTTAGNAAFQQCDYDAAGQLYDAAYREARSVFASAWNQPATLAEHAAPMMVVSAVNAARDREQQGKPEAAGNQLFAAAHSFICALKSPSSPVSLKFACASHLPRLLFEMGQFQYTFTPNYNQVVSEAKAAALAFWNTASH